MDSECKIFMPQPTSFTLQCDGKPLVTIKHDGALVYGENYTPGAAAKIFWGALGRGATAIAQEREACAKVAADLSKSWLDSVPGHHHLNMKHRAEGMSHGAKLIAAAIRSRGQE